MIYTGDSDKYHVRWYLILGGILIDSRGGIFPKKDTSKSIQRKGIYHTSVSVQFVSSTDYYDFPSLKIGTKPQKI